MALVATLRLALYRDEQVLVGEAGERLHLAPHTVVERDAEALLGHFVDLSYAYRFGALQQDTVVATLETPDEVLSQAFLYPAGMRRVDPRAAADLGLTADARDVGADLVELRLTSDRVVHGVRLRAEGLEPADDGFDLEPGRVRAVALRGRGAGRVRVTALNLADALEVAVG
jgi:beta-mannosidase